MSALLSSESHGTNDIPVGVKFSTNPSQKCGKQRGEFQRFDRWMRIREPCSVGSRTGAGRRRLSLSVAPRFLWECLTSRIVRWFPAPASSNPACRFPALGFPVCFASRVMWPIHADWLSAAGSNDSIAVKQSECVVQPRRTPPFPAESFAPSSTHQVPPHLLFHPELNVGKAPA